MDQYQTSETFFSDAFSFVATTGLAPGLANDLFRMKKAEMMDRAAIGISQYKSAGKADVIDLPTGMIVKYVHFKDWSYAQRTLGNWSAETN